MASTTLDWTFMCHVWLKACWQYDQKWRKDFVLRFQLSTHISAFNLSRPTWMKQNSLDLKFSRAVWTFVQLQPINALSVSATVSAEVFCGTKKTLSLSPADSNWFIKKGWDFSASPYCVHNLPFGSYRVIVFTFLEKMTDRSFLRSTILWVSISICLLFCTENWRTILCKNTLYQQSLLASIRT